jgi:hypothetical protein
VAHRAADELGEGETRAGHILVGLLRDARDAVGTQRSRRSRPGLSALGFGERRLNPVHVVLNARGLSLERLHAAVRAELRPVG